MHHVYTPPRIIPAEEIPAGVLSFLNGEDLLSKTQTLRLSTVDAEGWPHAALLSAGDALALPNGRLRFAIYPRSGTAANLARDGRLTLSMSLEGGMCELRMRARKCGTARLEGNSAEIPRAAVSSCLSRVRQVAPPARPNQ